MSGAPAVFPWSWGVPIARDGWRVTCHCGALEGAAHVGDGGAAMRRCWICIVARVPAPVVGTPAQCAECATRNRALRERGNT